MKKETKTVVFEITTFDELGETDGVYTVGDTVKATVLESSGKVFGSLTGEIKEILINEERGIHQLKLHTGWCCHPNEFYRNRDEVEIIKAYEQQILTSPLLPGNS